MEMQCQLLRTASFSCHSTLKLNVTQVRPRPFILDIKAEEKTRCSAPVLAGEALALCYSRRREDVAAGSCLFGVELPEKIRFLPEKAGGVEFRSSCYLQQYKLTEI